MNESFTDDVTRQGIWTDHQTLTGGHTTNHGHVVGVFPYRYEDCDRYGCKTVAVVDYDDFDQVERIRTIVDQRVNMLGHTYIWNEDVAKALRAFANPAPPEKPKPDEPLGLGAVVRDAEGVRWVLAGNHHDLRMSDNWRAYEGDALVGSWRSWSDIDAVTVLSEGVTQ